jgi:DNA-binding MarR family transcriptional regulator
MTAPPPYRGLGTLLRHLLELLDGDVELAYRDLGLDYRPRFTPVMRALTAAQPRSIREIADHSGLTHSAVSQTVAEMRRAGLVGLGRDRTDARARLVRLTTRGRALLPKLQRQWAATNAAADELDAELPASLRATVTEAIAALERNPFRSRIRTSVERKRP